MLRIATGFQGARPMLRERLPRVVEAGEQVRFIRPATTTVPRRAPRSTVKCADGGARGSAREKWLSNRGSPVILPPAPTGLCLPLRSMGKPVGVSSADMKLDCPLGRPAQVHP